jgi:biopolymer transport protein ExbD
MSFIPHEELKEKSGLSLAPMIDFLFLMLAVFASLAVSRIMIKDTELDLVKSEAAPPSSAYPYHDMKLINLSIASDGSYQWVTEIRDYNMESAEAIAEELLNQYRQGILPEDKLKTQILLKIDRRAAWEPILNLVLAIKEAGFEVRPLYEPVDAKL